MKINWKDAKSMFFDESKITKGMAKAEKQYLSKAGGLIRKVAQRSIRKRKKPSQPGSPPHSHQGRLKKFLFYGLDEKNGKAFVGPVLLGKPAEGSNKTVPEILEYGGDVTINEVVFWKTGEWVTDDRKYRRRKWYKVAKKRKRRATIQPRPYMQPALKESQSKLPGLWRGKFKR